MELKERKQHAGTLHSNGYNCAQSVLMSFADVTELPESVASRIAMGLGGGFGAQGELCGVLLGMALTLGMARGSDPVVKPKVNAEVRELTRRFKERNGGCFLCRELKSKCRRPCDDIIADGVEILHEYLEETHG